MSLIASLMIFFAVALIMVVAQGSSAAENSILINIEAYLFIAFILFSIVFLTDLIIYHANKRAYRMNNAFASNGKPIPAEGTIADQVQEELKQAEDNTAAHLATTEAFFEKNELLYEKDEVITKDHIKELSLFQLTSFALGGAIKPMISLGILTVITLVFSILTHWLAVYAVCFWIFVTFEALIVLGYFASLSKNKKAFMASLGKTRTRIFDNRIETIELNEDGSVKCLKTQIMFTNTNIKETKKNLFIKGTYNNLPACTVLNKKQLGEEVINKIKKNLTYSYAQINLKKNSILFNAVFAAIQFLLIGILFAAIVMTITDPKYVSSEWWRFLGGILCFLTLMVESIYSAVSSAICLKKWNNK